MNRTETNENIIAARKLLYHAWNDIQSAREMLQPFLTNEQLEQLREARITCTMASMR